MTVRTSKKTVTFRRPFTLCGLDEVLPAGAYIVETDEELLDGISFLAYRRILTLIHLRATHGGSDFTRTLTIDPKDLEAAQKRDQVPEAIADNRGTNEKRLNGTTVLPRDTGGLQAIEAHENKGTIVHPR